MTKVFEKGFGENTFFKKFFSKLIIFKTISVFFLLGSLDVEEERSLKAILKLRYFTDRSDLLTPSNLNFALEYYLLENLAAGLVYENWYSPSNWDPLLAEDWEQVSVKEWLFHLRKSLYWSDGSPMLLAQMKAHFEALRDRGSRHITALREMQDIEIDETGNTLLFQFREAVNESLIHELALADTMLLHPKNLKGDWSISSGPYYVASQSREKLVLKANQYFVGGRPPIQTVEILPPKTVDSKGSFDIWKRPAYSFHPDVQKLESFAERVWDGYPVTVYYFRFHRQHELFHQEKMRLAFGQLVAEAFEGTNVPHSIVYEDQMIPKGFKGRLGKWKKQKSGDVRLLREAMMSLNDKTLKVLWPPKADPFLSEKLIATARKHSVPLSIVFAHKEGQVVFAEFTNVVGNQRDPLGTWSFLYGAGGPAHDFYPELRSLLDDIAKHPLESERTEILQKVHRTALEHAHLVPFMAEHNAILASNAVDLKRTNPFDQRLRFFEMTWTQ